MKNKVGIKRKSIDKITDEIIRLIARRNRLAVEIGRLKKRVTDKKREEKVLLNAKNAAKKYGVDAKLAEKISKILISHSKKIQRRKHD